MYGGGYFDYLQHYFKPLNLQGINQQSMLSEMQQKC